MIHSASLLNTAPVKLMEGARYAIAQIRPAIDSNFGSVGKCSAVSPNEHQLRPARRRGLQPTSGRSKAEHCRAGFDRRMQQAALRAHFPGSRLVPDTACGKTRYPDRPAAGGALAHIRCGGQIREHSPIRAYACSACGGWHLTSQAA